MKEALNFDLDDYGTDDLGMGDMNLGDLGDLGELGDTDLGDLGNLGMNGLALDTVGTDTTNENKVTEKSDSQDVGKEITQSEKIE